MQNTLVQIAPGSEAMRRPLRVGLCGEVSSGKSALANALARTALMPDLFGISHDVVIRVEPSANAGWTGVFVDGSKRPLDPNIPLPVHDGLRELVIHSGRRGEHLKGMELIELPAMCHENIRDLDIERIRECDVIIWTTIGSQAWRLSEKTVLEAFGDARPAHSILAITRGDKFRSEEDRAKVLSRVVGEAGHQFDKILMTGAAGKTVVAAAEDDMAWTRSGGAEIHAFLASLMTEIDSTDQNAVVVGDGQEADDNTVVAISDYRDAPVSADVPGPAPERPIALGDTSGILAVAIASSADFGALEMLHETLGPGSDHARLAAQLSMAVRDHLGDAPEILDLEIGDYHVVAGPMRTKRAFLILVADGHAMTRGAARVRHAKLVLHPL